jgi:hypothetical protein
VISKWLGHATASFTMATSVHSHDAMTLAGGDVDLGTGPV